MYRDRNQKVVALGRGEGEGPFWGDGNFYSLLQAVVTQMHTIINTDVSDHLRII